MPIRTGAQIAAARALLRLSQIDLALLANVGEELITELEKSDQLHEGYRPIEAALVQLGIAFDDSQGRYCVSVARSVDGMSAPNAAKARKTRIIEQARLLSAADKRLARSAIRAAVLRKFDEFRGERSIRSTIKAFVREGNEGRLGLQGSHGKPIKLSSRTLWNWLAARRRNGEGGLVPRWGGARRSALSKHPELRAALIELVKSSNAVSAAQASAELKRRFPDVHVGLSPRSITRAINTLVAKGEIGRRPSATNSF